MGVPVPKPSHKRRKPKRVNRGKFSGSIRKKIFERDEGLCRVCHRPGTQIHHVVPKSSSKGRGVFSNGMTVCNRCHQDIHDNYSQMRYWQIKFYETYGDGFWKDEYD